MGTGSSLVASGVTAMLSMKHLEAIHSAWCRQPQRGVVHLESDSQICDPETWTDSLSTSQ